MIRSEFNEDQKSRIRKEVSDEVRRQNEFISNVEYNEIKNQFVDKFVMCERVYKLILKESNIIDNIEVDDKDLKLQISQIYAVLKAAGYSFDELSLDKLFKGVGKYRNRGTKSAKNLRNGVVHGFNANDLLEIVERKDELFELMDRFIKEIQE